MSPNSAKRRKLLHAREFRRCLALVALAALASACDSVPGQPAKPKAIFLVVVDTLRADALSAYGSARHVTPKIDALAARGVLFERVQAPAPWTRPAMASLLTSRHPTELGLVEAASADAGEFEWRQHRPQLARSLPDSARTLAEQLKAAGFETAAFVNQPLLGIAGSGFRRGFDAWYAPTASGEIAHFDPQRAAPPQSRDLRNAHVGDQALVEEFGRWAQQRQSAPVFVWLHLLTPHSPYTSWPAGEALPPGPQVRADIAYDGEVRVVDAIVGRAIDIIDARFGLDHSVVVFTSDHGEEFGEHEMFEHGHSLHREVVEVPLIVVAPGYAAGSRVAMNVRSLDVLPTLLELAGRPDLTPTAARGESLTATLGEAGDRDAYVEGVWYGSTERSFQADGYKLMFDAQGDRWRLYDVDVDPGENRDLAQQRPQIVAQLRARLLQRHSETRAAWESMGATPDESGASLDPETRSALQALGYLESPSGRASSR